MHLLATDDFIAHRIIVSSLCAGPRSFRSLKRAVREFGAGARRIVRHRVHVAPAVESVPWP